MSNFIKEKQRNPDEDGEDWEHPQLCWQEIPWHQCCDARLTAGWQVYVLFPCRHLDSKQLLHCFVFLFFRVQPSYYCFDNVISAKFFSHTIVAWLFWSVEPLLWAMVPRQLIILIMIPWLRFHAADEISYHLRMEEAGFHGSQRMTPILVIRWFCH